MISWESYQKEPPAEAMIRHWFESWPTANVGIVTGAVSDAVVIDLDSAEAKEKIKALVPNYDLGAVPRVRTGRAAIICFSSIQAEYSNPPRESCPRPTCVPMAAMLLRRHPFTRPGKATYGKCRSAPGFPIYRQSCSIWFPRRLRRSIATAFANTSTPPKRSRVYPRASGMTPFSDSPASSALSMCRAIWPSR